MPFILWMNNAIYLPGMCTAMGSVCDIEDVQEMFNFFPHLWPSSCLTLFIKQTTNNWGLPQQSWGWSQAPLPRSTAELMWAVEALGVLELQDLTPVGMAKPVIQEFEDFPPRFWVWECGLNTSLLRASKWDGTSTWKETFRRSTCTKCKEKISC